jgi:hypothetical protein
VSLETNQEQAADEFVNYFSGDGSLAYQKVRWFGDEMQDWLVIVREKTPVGKCARRIPRLPGSGVWVSFRLRQAGEGSI